MDENLSDLESLRQTKQLDLVYKSSELIEAQYSLSAGAQKVTAILISQINPNDDILPKFDLSISEYSALMGISPQAVYKSIDSVTTELKRLMVTLRKRNSRSFIKLSIFRECHYDDELKRVWFEFENRLDEHLRDFAGNFTRYQVKHIKRLKSRYAIRLYELLRKVHPIRTPKKYSIYPVSLLDLRLMLGIPDEKYAMFSDFRKSVLDKSMNMLREDTDICFQYEGVRKGRRIELIKFTVSHNNLNHDKSMEIEEGHQPEIILTLDSKIRVMANQFLPWLPDVDLEAMADFGKQVLVESIMDMMTALGKHDIAEKSKVSYFKKIVNANYKASQVSENETGNGKTLHEKMTDRSWDDGLELDV